MRIELDAPVEYLGTEAGEPAEGIALCLSGGGYRAMLFHLGVLWRLAEMGYLSEENHTGLDGTLGTLERISSVSGGSITSALMGLRWQQLRIGRPDSLTRFVRDVVTPIRGLADKTIIAIGSGLRTMLLPGSINDHVAKKYRKHLFGDATLQHLPDHPRFVINATNLQSGALWRFMKPYMRDWKVGKVENPKISIARAVAASSAFPPFLSPARFKIAASAYKPNTGGDGPDDLQRPPFTTRPVLSDGGVYDNLGLETAWKRYKTILVSDAGGQMQPQQKVATGWARQSYRVLSVIDHQVRSLRKRHLINSYIKKRRSGAFWGIRTDIGDYRTPGALPCPHDKTMALARTPTDLAKKDPVLQERIINWGYAVCDAAMRRYVDSAPLPPPGFPYPASGVG